MRFLVPVLLLVTLSTAVIAEDLYADVVFDVQSDGSVQISGTTNHPLLEDRTTQDFTSKTRQRWLLNLTAPGRFVDYVFTVKLPPGATLSYAKGKDLSIGSDGDRVTLKSYGQNDVLDISAQYVIESKVESIVYEVISSVVAALAICAVLLLGYWHGNKRAQKLAKKKMPKLVDGLPQRQQDILNLLHKSGGALTQKQIEQTLMLPKASISRNIESLRKKGLLEKQQSGMSNVVRLKNS